MRPDFGEDNTHIGHPRIVACTSDGHSAAVCAFSGSTFFALLLMGAGVALAPKAVSALPSFARQTGQPCSTCHSGFPQLTPYGRRFKLEGYTAGGTRCGSSDELAERELQIPIAGMTVPNFTHINKKLDPTDTPKGFSTNNNTFDEATSVFYGGQDLATLEHSYRAPTSAPAAVGFWTTLISGTPTNSNWAERMWFMESPRTTIPLLKTPGIRPRLGHFPLWPRRMHSPQLLPPAR